MFKYLAILVLALAAVMAAPPAPQAAVRGPAPVPRDLNTASQLVYSYGGYPAYGYSSYAAVPAYSSGYAYYG